jgi:tripeptide aminopeptidase
LALFHTASDVNLMDASLASPASPVPEFCSQRAEQLVLELMQIPGTSGQEAEVAALIREKLRQAGADPRAIQHDTAHRRTRISGQVGNLIFNLPGAPRTKRTARRMLSAHLDTVPICVGSRPQRRGNLVRSAAPNCGLGADNRAGCSVLLATALHLLENNWPHPPLTFCWFVQEEIGLEGSRHVSLGSLGNPQLAFNWDGGSPTKLTIGATGGYRLEIDIQGRASHAGGAPEQGVSAIVIAARAIADLHQRGWHGRITQPQGMGTSNVGVIRGGDATNVVTDRVLVRAEARSHDRRFRRAIVKQIEQAFRRAAREVTSSQGRHGSVKINGRLDYESFLLAADEPCVVAAQAAIDALGLTAELAVSNGGVDANWTTRHGIPTVTLGCGQVNPHMTSEALDMKQFLTACRIALLLGLGAGSAAVPGPS